MAIKIDLDKVYDKFSWNFIKDTIMEVGFSPKWIRNIMSCIESSRMAILWNGEQLNWIKPGQGIRQGDSVSPYIFVLCIERLNHNIGQAVSNGSWREIRLREMALLSITCFLQMIWSYLGRPLVNSSQSS